MATNNPRFELFVGGERLSQEIGRFITRAEMEFADGIADMMRISVSNPYDAFTDARLFQPGNKISLYGGYGQTLTYMGTCEVARPDNNFPRDGMPNFEVVAYSREHLMMDNSPDKGSKRVFRNARLSQIAARIASDYNFTLDVDDFDFGRSIVQKVGITDYEFIKGLCNIIGYVMWVDVPDPLAPARLHLRDPGTDGSGLLRGEGAQITKYTLTYGTPLGSLTEFRPEFTIRNHKTKLRVLARDPQTGRLFEEEFVDDARAPDVRYRGTPIASDKISDQYQSAGSVKLSFGNFAIEVATREFTSAAALKQWAANWFRDNRDNFIQGSGSCVGLENLRCRHTHKLGGLGNLYNGDYYFARVRHIFDVQQGYQCEFNARKVVGGGGGQAVFSS